MRASLSRALYGGSYSSVEFTYRLTGPGWSEAVLSDGQHSATLTASYLSDALGELLDALIHLRGGAEEVRCSWEEEPGEYRWIFKRSDGRIALAILWFEDLADEPDEAGRLVFETRQELDALTDAIAAGTQRLLADVGEVGYRREWIEHAFPSDALERLVRES
jgi:hypothetical protein